MDDPFVGPITPIRLQRACERNRLEKQFLIDAYEHLVMLVVPEECSRARDDSATSEENSGADDAHVSEACGVGHE